MTNFYTQLNPFYANDGRGVQYTNLNYKGTDFESAVNSIDDVDNIIGEPVFQLMIRKNMEGVSDNTYDISEQFVDFIIKTALFHRSIDTPTSSPNLDIALRSLNDDKILNIIAKELVPFVLANKVEITNIGMKNSTLLAVTYTTKLNYIKEVNKSINALIPIIKIITSASALQKVLMQYVLRGLASSIYFINEAINSNKITSYNDSDFNKIYKNLILSVLSKEISEIKDKLPKGTSVNALNSDIFNNIYKYWNTLDNDVRKFYMANLILMQKSPITPGKWITVNYLDNLSLSADNYRLNFKKSLTNPTRTVFSECLPLVPSVSETLYFTNDKDEIKTINLNDLSDKDKKEILKNIYDSVYKTGTLILEIKGVGTRYPINNSIPTENQFKLNYYNFFNNSIKFWQAQTKKGPENFEDIYVDIVSNKMFSKDNTGLYTLVNNEKVYYNDAKLMADLNNNCYGTYIKDGSQQCSIVMKCILNNTPQKLVRCLHDIRNEALFDVAKNDIQNINPTIMKNIIKSFGFKIRKETDGVYRPLDYSEWVKSSEINSELKDLLKTNKKLNIYLREILNIIRSNPLIINENLVEEQKDYSKYNMRVFRNPIIGKNLSVNNHYDLLSIQPRENQTFEMPFFVNLSQTGGATGCVNNSETLRKVFNHLFAQLVESGKELKDEDKQRILDAIDQAVKLETRLNNLIQEIELYTRLSKMLKDTNAIDAVDLSEIHEITTNKEKLDETLVKIKEKINKNLVAQQTLFQTLVVAQRPLMTFLLP
jgi:hypothetical protein